MLQFFDFTLHDNTVQTHEVEMVGSFLCEMNVK